MIATLDICPSHPYRRRQWARRRSTDHIPSDARPWQKRDSARDLQGSERGLSLMQNDNFMAVDFRFISTTAPARRFGRQ
jgi:hypothetical protein